MDNNNEAPMIDSDNDDDDDDNDEIFTNNISSNSASPSVNYRIFSQGGNLKKYIDFPWLYYNAADEGYHCKICEIFPQLSK